MNLTLFKANWKANWKVLMIFSVIMIFYFSMIIVMYDPMTTDSMAALIEMLPQELINMMGFTLKIPTYTGFIASYFYGFLAIMFPTILLIMVSYRLMGKLIDRGSMAYLLATPNSRVKVATTQAVSLMTLLTAIQLLITLAGIGFSTTFFAGQLEVSKFILINVGVWCYFFAVSSLSFFASAFFNEGRHAISVGSAFPVGFFVIQMIAQLGEEMEVARYLTLLSLFQPSEILTDGYSLTPLIALVVIGIVGYATSIWMFKHRDLPL